MTNFFNSQPGNQRSGFRIPRKSFTDEIRDDGEILTFAIGMLGAGYWMLDTIWLNG
jgi:hypothetical protein